MDNSEEIMLSLPSHHSRYCQDYYDQALIPTPNHHSSLWLSISIWCNVYVGCQGGDDDSGGDVCGKILINFILDAINL